MKNRDSLSLGNRANVLRGSGSFADGKLPSELDNWEGLAGTIVRVEAGKKVEVARLAISKSRDSRLEFLFGSDQPVRVFVFTNKDFHFLGVSQNVRGRDSGLDSFCVFLVVHGCIEAGQKQVD